MPNETNNAPTITSAEMFGVVKNIDKQLEQFPIPTHSAMVQLLTIAFNHRNQSAQYADHQQSMNMKQQELNQQKDMIELERNRQNAGIASQLANATKQ